MSDPYSDPISPQRAIQEQMAYGSDPEAYRATHEVYPAGFTSVRSETLIALWDMMDAIVKGVDWQKKARIVLEYDPREKKMGVTVFRSADETQTTEDQ